MPLLNEGQAPLAVTFDAATFLRSRRRISSPIAGSLETAATARESAPIHTYSKNGNYTAILTVTDDEKAEFRSLRHHHRGHPPVARVSANPTSGNSPLNVHFDGSESYDADGIITSYKWDFGDGTSGNGQTASHTYTSLATRLATLTVRDNEGLEASVFG